MQINQLNPDIDEEQLAGEMDDLRLQSIPKDALRPDTSRIFQETLVTELLKPDREIYRCPRLSDPTLATQAGSLTHHREWSQVFDLGPTQLVATARGNTLTMQLLHWTLEPLITFCQKDETQSFQIVDPQNADLLFEEHSAAKLVFDGMIVPEMYLTQNSATSCLLELATTAGVLYKIAFAPFFLKKGSTMTVTSELIPCENATLTNFAVVRDPDTSTKAFIYGFAVESG